MVGTSKKTKRKIEREGRYGRYKTRRSRRMAFVKVPGGRTVVQFKARKHKHARCAGCGAVLKGISRERPYRMKKTAKNRKKVSRIYGGYLCSRCAKKKIIEGARS